VPPANNLPKKRNRWVSRFFTSSWKIAADKQADGSALPRNLIPIARELRPGEIVEAVIDFTRFFDRL
jgi:hypothetical protein